MGWVVAFGSQKGGVGKSTLAQGFAVTVADMGASVMIGDLDAGQYSTMEWARDREDFGVTPKIPVRKMSPKGILEQREAVNVLVLDLSGDANDVTLAVAEQSDLFVVVTGTPAIELRPTVDLLKALRDKGFDSPRVVAVLTRVRDKDHAQAAADYLREEGFTPLPDWLPDYASIQEIGNRGKATPEIQNAAVKVPSQKFFKGLLKALDRATEAVRVMADKAKAREKGKAREGVQR